tara:strand:- start:235 stop:1875 length:1641 start_codon:yes stop_codon:yes gene_type:complete
MGGFVASRNDISGPARMGSNPDDVHQITGSVYISGTLVANAYQVVTTTMERVHSSGSTIWGDTTNDIHQFTGSAKFNNSIDVNGDTTFGAASSNVFRINSQVTASSDILVDSNFSVNETAYFASRVGIGTDSPTTLLNVEGDVSGSAFGIFTGGLVTEGDLNVSGSTTFAGPITFQSQLTGSQGAYFNNRVGIGDNTPETLLKLKGAEAYITLQNSTDENTEGGAETKIIFEDHSDTTLAVIQVSHDGTGNDTKGDIILSTHNGTSLTEALRIDSQQRVGIGDSDPGTMLQIQGSEPYLTLQNSTVENTDGGCESKVLFENHNNVSLAAIQGSHDGSSNDSKGDLMLFTHNGSSLVEAMRIDSNQYIGVGGITAPTHRITLPLSPADNNGSVKATQYATYSSARYKENIAPIAEALMKLMKIQGVKFSWKNSGKEDFGFVAEEVGEVVPEIVQYEQNGVDAESMEYSKVTPILVEAMKEISTKVDALISWQNKKDQEIFEQEIRLQAKERKLNQVRDLIQGLDELSDIAGGSDKKSWLSALFGKKK